MTQDYYKILGVDKNATQAEIKKAFRKKAQQYHPDKKGGDEKKFKEVNEANTVLSNKQKRQQYDAYGSAGSQMGGGAGYSGGQDFGGFDFSGFSQGGGQGFEFNTEDIFSSFFNQGGNRQQQARGNDISVSLELTFSESIFGTKKTFQIMKNSVCDVCAGSGAEKGSALKTCSVCNGDGRVVKIKQTILGAVQMQATCSHCHGTGKIPEKKCSICQGKGIVRKKEEISVNIPAGVETGQKLRVAGKGEAVFGGQAGDLYIFISVQANPNFEKRYHDLYTKINISLTTAVLGGTVEVQGVDEKIKIKIKAGTPNEKVMKIKGKGVGEKKGRRGDLYVTIQVDIPTKLSMKEKKLFKELKSLGI